jgi:YHS domain-containing protein
MKIAFTLFIMALFSCSKDCGKQAEMRREAEANRNKFAGVKFDSNIDLVCKMSLEEGISDTVHYNEKIYGFCSADCKTQFVAAPERY